MSNTTLSLVDAVVIDVLQLRPELEPMRAGDPGMEGARPMVRIRNGAGDLVVRVFTQDPEVNVSFQVETWSGMLHAEASFSNMPAAVVAAAIVAALELQF